MVKTTKKRPVKPFTGVEGKTFSASNQPTPEAKSNGWKERRAERLLTQKILEKMTKGSTLDDYVEALYKSAVMGNSKAIDTINKGIEDDVIKIANTDGFGNDVPPEKPYSRDELIQIIKEANGRTASH